MTNIPTYFIKIGDLMSDLGMSTISLVESPAVGRNFLCFEDESHKEQLKFKADELKHNITGVAMIADTPIYRYSEEYGGYYIVFTKEVIEEMAVKYSMNANWNKVNLQHNSQNYTDSAIMYEMYIKDSARGIQPIEFSDVPDGSLLVSFHITDAKLWEDIMNSGELNGFSIEVSGIVERAFSEQKEETLDDLINKCLK